MNRQRWIVFLLLTLLFVIVAGLLTWDRWMETQNTFPAGTRPSVTESQAVQPIRPSTRPTDPARGSADPKALIITMFGGYDCLYCRAIEPEILTAMQKASKPTKFIWRDLPIPNGRPDGIVATLSARCALDQGKFWDLHDRMMQAQSLDLTTIKNSAQAIGLNMSTFNQCVTEGKHLSTIQGDVSLAQQHNITGTPTVFIGDRMIDGYADAATILNTIERASNPENK